MAGHKPIEQIPRMLKFAKLLCQPGISQIEAWRRSGHTDNVKNASRAAHDPRVVEYVAAHPAPPPAARPPTPRKKSNTAISLATPPPQEFDPIAEAEFAVQQARGNPSAHRRALGILASLYRFAGDRLRKPGEEDARSVRASAAGSRDGISLVDDSAALDEFLDQMAGRKPIPFDESNCRAFCAADGMTPEETERVVAEARVEAANWTPATKPVIHDLSDDGTRGEILRKALGQD